MSEEIVYTSAPEGLHRGARGFCVVASTDMPRTLAERLESLSGYRHAFPPNTPEAAQNPVNFTHAVLRIGGQNYHVLSRVADAGLDYTRRSNKLAHHLAYSRTELNTAGPAWSMKQSGFFQTAWSGDPHAISNGKPLPTGSAELNGPCQAWQNATGDAGWAGVLAESATAAQPQSVIFRPGQDVLPLVAEALSLLPPEKRWDVTFSTYFTRLPAGTTCQWRFVLDGTTEATALRRSRHSNMIDLCDTLAKAPDTPLTEAARTGQLPSRHSAEPVATRNDDKAVQFAEYPTGASTPTHTPPDEDYGDGTYRLSPEPGAKLPPRDKPPSRLNLLETQDAAPKLSTGQLLILMVSIFIVVMGGIVGSVLFNRPETSIQINQEAVAAAEAKKNQPVVTQTDTNSSKPEPKPAVKPAEPKKKAPEIELVSTTKPPPLEIEPKPIKPEPTQKSALADIRQRGAKLILPINSQSVVSLPNPELLAHIYVDDPLECSLSVMESEKILNDGRRFEAKPQDSDEGSRIWHVHPQREDLVGPHVGTFELSDQELTFQWAKTYNKTAKPELFPFCMLRIQAGGEYVDCALGEPKNMEPIELDLGPLQHDVGFKISSEALPPTELLKMDLRYTGMDDVKTVWNQHMGLSAGTGNEHVATLKISPDAINLGNRMDLKFQWNGKNGGSLTITPVVHAKQTDNGQTVSSAAGRDSSEGLKAFHKKKTGDLKKVSGRIAAIPREIEKAERLLATGKQYAKTKLDELKSLPGFVKGPQRNKLQQEIAQSNAAIDEIDRELKRLNTELSSKKKQEQQLIEAVQWSEDLDDLFTKVESESQIHFQLYMQLNGRRVPVLQTEGWDSVSE